MRGARVMVGSLFAVVVLWAAQPRAGAVASPRSGLSAQDGRVNALLARMSLDEKIGQMTQPDQEFLQDEADVENLAVGSVLSGGNSDPRTNSFEDWRALYERLQARALKSRLKPYLATSAGAGPTRASPRTRSSWP